MTLKCEYCGEFKSAELREWGIDPTAKSAMVSEDGVVAASKEIRAEFKRKFVIPTEREIVTIISKHCSSSRGDSCWHCGVVLAYVPKLRCEDCREECDVEGCEELGCATPATPSAEPRIYFCSCGGALTETEYALHRSWGHDSGEEVFAQSAIPGPSSTVAQKCAECGHEGLLSFYGTCAITVMDNSTELGWRKCGHRCDLSTIRASADDAKKQA